MTSMMAGAMAAGSSLAGGQPSAPAAEFYVWRQYILRTGTQPRRLSEYLQQAAVPALNRLGHRPIGVFEAIAGVPSPTAFVLIPCPTLDSVARIEAGLDRDAEYTKAAAAYLDAPATDPAYVRMETSILSAFPSVPRLEPPSPPGKPGRVFELRIYESPSEKAHLAKVRMFDEMGEIAIFRKVGLTPVFFARTLAGARMPSLVYMLAHDDMAAREKAWAGFRTSPDWKKLSATPGYSDAEIVSNITTVFLRGAAAGQL